MSDKPCCNCGYNGQEETSCFAREDKLHCECWYDGDSATEQPTQPHAMTREQCSLCTANRPRLCDQHYKQGADELLKHVTAAIQDQQTPGGVKATYEQLLELCNQQRQALAQQAQEIEHLKKECFSLAAGSCEAPYGDDYGNKRCKTIDDLKQQLAAMTAERDAFRAVLQGAEYEQIDRIGTLSVEVAQRIGVAAAHRTKEIIAQLAAMTAERDEIAARWKHDFELRCDEEEKNEQLNKQLAASQARVGELEEVINKADYRHIMDPPDGGDPTLAEKAKYLVDRISHANTQIATLQATLAAREEQLRLANIDQANTEAALNDARQDAARLREALGKEINTSRFESAPCYLCGYNGKLYFQPSTHPCAEWYHIAKQRALKGA